MHRKRSFFILEIVIAMVLVGLFSVYFLRASIKHLHQERQALLVLEFEWQNDLRKMEILKENWPQKGVFIKPHIPEEPYHVTFKNRTYTSPIYVYDLSQAKESSTALELHLHEEQKGGGSKKDYIFFAIK